MCTNESTKVNPLQWASSHKQIKAMPESEGPLFSYIVNDEITKSANTGDEWATIKYKMYAPVRHKIIEGN